MAGRHSRAEWTRIVAEAERSGDVEQVAQRHDVRPRTLTWWRWRLRRERRLAERGGPRMLPVVVRSAVIAAERPAALAIDVRDVRVRIEMGSDVGYVAELVAALRTC